MIKKKIQYKTGSTYNFNILLSRNVKDMGFFDTLDDTEIFGTKIYSGTTGYTFVNSYDFSNYTGDSTFNFTYTVTGTSDSRLEELSKYTVSTDPYVKYFTGGGLFNDGLDTHVSGSTGITFTYYIGGIKYVDIIVSGLSTTSFSFTNTGYSTDNFDNKRIIKYESKENMVENPQVNKDVFIVRQQQSVFEKNYRLRGIGSLNDISTYAGGNYFNIYNNT